MRRFYLFSLALALLSPALCRAQSPARQVDSSLVRPRFPHLQFMGIPIDGPRADLTGKLKAKGFEYVEETSPNISRLKGEFAGVAGALVDITSKSDRVWKVSVRFPCQQHWGAVKRRYLYYKGSLASKYNLEPVVNEVISPRYKEGSGAEMWGFDDESSVYESVYFLEDGRIVLRVEFDGASQSLRVVTDYIDRLNYMVKEHIELEDI